MITDVFKQLQGWKAIEVKRRRRNNSIRLFGNTHTKKMCTSSPWCARRFGCTQHGLSEPPIVRERPGHSCGVRKRALSRQSSRRPRRRTRVCRRKSKSRRRMSVFPHFRIAESFKWSKHRVHGAFSSLTQLAIRRVRYQGGGID